MTNTMLIDATHTEEVRVSVVHGNRVEDFDFETEAKKQLKGNIYLAKVTRVEPSLQAAFVDYGGNRHGFLAFAEIHPDYYQIPLADRQALLEEAEADAAADEDVPDNSDQDQEQQSGQDASDQDKDDDNQAEPESLGQDDAIEDIAPRRKRSQKRYKIQDVIKRRQIILVQIVKEERGTKGAALTSYLSLAGRYSVLMPNTPRGGGISRKITNAVDRKRLKTLVQSLEVPKGMGVILRTAGANRTKAEIKRDYNYLMKLWEQLRAKTLSSIAPDLVHEEGSLIKRSIRDIYSKDIDSVVVAGDDGYREAKDFMRILMPSHAKNVKPYKEDQPIFTHYGVENQLDAMFSPTAHLRSGGYLVIDQTEALVSIDVNSGKSTREHSIEETALNTNMEAASEVARQLRLRDLAGLVVIDFIDMEDRRNNRAVERHLKECLKNDRARIQVGQISAFGLLEMSRQRLRASVLESTMEICTHCAGTGSVRAPSSIALSILRHIEDQLINYDNKNILVQVKPDVALYLFNEKRANVTELEARYDVSITIDIDTALYGDHFVLKNAESLDVLYDSTTVQPPIPAKQSDHHQADGDDTGRNKKKRRRRRRKGSDDNEKSTQRQNQEQNDDDEGQADDQSVKQDDEQNSDDKPKRRRRGRRGGRNRNANANNETERQDNQDAKENPAYSDDVKKESDAEAENNQEKSLENPTDSNSGASENSNIPKPKSSRRKRGASTKINMSSDNAPDAFASNESEQKAKETVATNIQKEAHSEMDHMAMSAVESPVSDTTPQKTKKTKSNRVKAVEAETEAHADNINSAQDQNDKLENKRKGWWQKRSFFSS